MKVLLIGDSENLSQTISLTLRVRWPELSLLHATAVREGIKVIHREQPNIVMLHRDSAAVDCFDLVSQIRSFSDVALIILSEKDNVMDKIRALEMGADDWITPSSIPMEFIAKVNAILRRRSPRSNDRPSYFFSGKLSINFATRKVCVQGKSVKLTPIEYKILCELVRNEGSVVDRANLLRNVWGPNYRADTEFLKKYIYRLRSKIEEDLTNPKIILNKRGVGYIFISSSNSAQ